MILKKFKNLNIIYGFENYTWDKSLEKFQLAHLSKYFTGDSLDISSFSRMRNKMVLTKKKWQTL